jgi:nucleotide-binding universal stress UspA family protein
MPIHSILVNFDVGGFSPALLTTVVDLAERFDAEIVGFAGAEPFAAYVGMGNGMAAAQAYAQERTAIEASLEVIEEQFRAGVPGNVPAQWRGMIVQPNRGLQNLARGADLVIVGSRQDQEPGARFVDPGDLVLKLGRPMLLAAANGGQVRGEKIVVGWKDTREARRAVADALPFLERASDVFVALVEERDYGEEWTSLKDVLHWLERHGVKARGEIVPSAGSPAETIASTAAEMGADLVVTGAYGHSRLREWLFGGVTQELLAASTSNRLMSS